MKFALKIYVLSAPWFIASDHVTQAQTIFDMVVADEDFSMLEAAVLAVPGVANILQTEEATVFAPNNAAFATTDQDLINKLLTTPAFRPHLQSMIFFHVIPGVTLLAADIVGSSSLQTLTDEDLPLNKNVDGSITVDGFANVIAADVMASNGVIHVLDQVLLLNWATVTAYSLAAAMEDASTLVQLINDAMLADTLNGPGPFTVFAPSNAAFEAALLADPTLNVTDIASVTSMLQRHVVADVVTLDDIVNGAAPTTLSGETLGFIVSPDGNVTVNGARISVNGGDNLVNNGVVHLLDEVILPTRATTTAPVALTAAPIPVVTAAPVATSSAPIPAVTTVPAVLTVAPSVAPTVAPTSGARVLGTYMAAASVMASSIASMLL